MNDGGRPVVAPVAVPDARAVYKRLFQYARPHWKTFVLGALGAALFSSTNGGMIYAVKRMLEVFQLRLLVQFFSLVKQEANVSISGSI